MNALTPRAQHARMAPARELPLLPATPAPIGQSSGLSLSYGIVHKHDGRIEPDSTPGPGATSSSLLAVRRAATRGSNTDQNP